MKICHNLRLHLKIVCWIFHIKATFTFWDMCTWDTWNIQKNNRCQKLAYFLRNLQTSRANNSKILGIKNAKSSGYCFYLYTNIWGDFQIYISVSLRRLAAKKFTQIYLRVPVLGKCLRRVFQVCLRRFLVGRDSLEVKKIIKVKFLWITAATAGRFYEWVSVFLEKRPWDVFRGTLS